MKGNIPMKKIMTIREVADYTGLPYSTIRHLVIGGALPHTQFGDRYFVYSGAVLEYFNMFNEPEFNKRKELMQDGKAQN